METRPFGHTGHRSTVCVFGAAAFYDPTPEQVETAMEQVIAAGVNHIDVAPSYGRAEECLGPWIERERERFFLGCKTTERTRAGAAAEMHRSLERLRTDRFDLYQLHAVNTMEELDQATGRDGALSAVVEARDQGLTRFIGITGHGHAAPRIYIEALARFDFDSVLFPINPRLFADPAYRHDATELLSRCQDRNAGVMVIKSAALRPWGERPHRYGCWYEPFDSPAEMQRAVNFALSQPVTALCSPGDLTILPLFIDACAHYVPMSITEQEEMIHAQAGEASIFA